MSEPQDPEAVVTLIAAMLLLGGTASYELAWDRAEKCYNALRITARSSTAAAKRRAVHKGDSGV